MLPVGGGCVGGLVWMVSEDRSWCSGAAWELPEGWQLELATASTANVAAVSARFGEVLSTPYLRDHPPVTEVSRSVRRVAGCV